MDLQLGVMFLRGNTSKNRLEHFWSFPLLYVVYIVLLVLIQVILHLATCN